MQGIPQKVHPNVSLQVHWLAAFNQIGKGGTVHVFNIYFSHSKLISLQKLPGWKKDSEITPTIFPGWGPVQVFPD